MIFGAKFTIPLFDFVLLKRKFFSKIVIPYKSKTILHLTNGWKKEQKKTRSISQIMLKIKIKGYWDRSRFIFWNSWRKQDCIQSNTRKDCHRRYGKMKIGFLTNGYFNLGEEGEIDINRFFKKSNGLAKFIDKILDKYDDHPSIYYTGNIIRYFKNFQPVNRYQHGRSANEFNKILEYDDVNGFMFVELHVCWSVLSIF